MLPIVHVIEAGGVEKHVQGLAGAVAGVVGHQSVAEHRDPAPAIVGVGIRDEQVVGHRRPHAVRIGPPWRGG